MFVYFGTIQDSWAVGNDHFSVSKNLPTPIQQVWDRLASACGHATKVGTMISWMSTAPDGTYPSPNEAVLSNRQDILTLAHPATAVEHITLSPHGGYFIRFADGTVQISQSGFSDTFYQLISPYLDPRCQSRQYSPVRHVFFGAHDAVVIQTDRDIVSANISPSLQAALQVLTHGELKAAGFVLGRNTVLCPCNPEQYFLEARSATGRSKHLHQLPSAKIPEQLMLTAMAKQSPSDDVLNSYICGPVPQTGLAVPIPPPQPPRTQPTHHRPTNSFSGLSLAPPNSQRTSNHRHTISYTVPPAINNLWNAITSQSPSVQSASHPDIPLAARERYGRLFTSESGGRPYLNGIEAAGVFLRSGLTKEDLSRIWEDADRDRNGLFDKEEFVQAMWRIEVQSGRVAGSSPQMGSQSPPTQWNAFQPSVPLSQQYHPPPLTFPTHVSPQVQPPPPYQSSPPGSGIVPSQPPTGLQAIEILVAVLCKNCGTGLAPSDIAYRTPTAEYFCTSCPPPSATQVLLTAGEALPRHKRSSLGCSGCWRDIKKGKMVWHCNKCWDKDLCQKCWGKTKRHCKHAATGQVAMMRVGKGSKGGDGDDDDGLGDVIEGVVSIATGGLL
ncbi:hypothetical protein FDECE_11484 [Fusarium decemcellulare]|nr:hypothetical protein FDECE_11484 [Fusarium decemcellulare]